MTRASIWAPIVAALFGVLWFGGMMRSASDPPGEMQIRKFGKLPILENGRIKPFDTFARVQLMLVNRRQEYYEYTDAKREKYKKHPAVRLMLDLMAEGYTQLYPRIPFAFAINDPAVRKFLQLPENPGNKFQMQQIMANQKAADKLAAILKKQQANQKLDPIEEKVLAAAAAACESSAFERAQRGVERLERRDVAGPGRLDRRARDERVELADPGLDLGQLGHAPSVCARVV